MGFKDQDFVYYCKDCNYDDSELFKAIEFNTSVDLSLEVSLFSLNEFTIELEDITDIPKFTYESTYMLNFEIWKFRGKQL